MACKLELGRAAAIEVCNKIYVPLHDLFGNVSALLGPKKEKLLETYACSSFGEEKEKTETFIGTATTEQANVLGKA